MWKKAKYHLTGSAPFIPHNGHLADPTNKWAKLMKQITSKRNKTDADYEEMARIEFLGGLYMGPDGPVIPASNVEAFLIGAAKKRSEGNLAKAGMFVDIHAPLMYTGPRTADGLWNDDSFRFSKGVTISRARVMRMRPIFKEWGAVIEVNYDDEQINLATLDTWVKIAGEVIGLGDWRPKFGRFEATKVIEGVE